MESHSVSSGMLRIHVRARDYVHHEGKWWRKVLRRDLSHQLVRWAHDAGLEAAVAYRSHLGFQGHGPIIDDLAGEVRNPQTIIIVEIVGDEHRLRAFIDRHRAMLVRAHIQFVEIQNWSLHHVHSAHYATRNDHEKKGIDHDATKQ
ncbi:MAG: DUF190 domain-containing protein [Thermomicrobiales bacterium]|nr:DUF190 domain-containing protein [Thermomicrobiales bacterium]